MSIERPARGLQDLAKKFLGTLRWEVQEKDSHTLHAIRRVGGNELHWALHFEDEKSFSQLSSPHTFVSQLMNKATDYDIFDIIGTDRIVETGRWSNEVQPLLDQRFAMLRNRHYGTWTNLMNRFATDIAAKQMSVIGSLLQKHFIKKPVIPHFPGEVDALEACTKWLVAGDVRVMVVKGNPGAGKSVFSLLLATGINRSFSKDPNRYPAPFLIWFSTERPAVLEDLIAVTLQDLGLMDLTVDTVKFLLSQGRIVFILDGFDEISRALAQRAEETVDKLGKEINKRTKGRLILTSRPAFLVDERVFSDLATACEETRPTQRDLAPLTDQQQREWVIHNAPDRPEARPPDRHWQRVQTAFAEDRDLRDLCRTPVYLRMLSEILVKERSVRSRYDLIEKFCQEMWERERSKRTLVLSDAQYLQAYEAISVAIVDWGRIDFGDVKELLEMYLGDFAQQLLSELPGEAETLIKDLAIGPLTCEAGRFSFPHEVLTGFFFARLLARTLRERGKQLRDLWNRKIYEPAWEFLPESVQQALQGQLDTEKMLRELSQEYRDGLMLWNIARSLGGPLPHNLFRGKDVAGVVFEHEIQGTILDLQGMVFDDCKMHDVTFIRCNLSGASFRNARIGHMKFLECGTGAVFDDNPVTDDAEIVLVRSPTQGEETYVGQDIGQALAILSGAGRTPVALPDNMAERAAVVILKSLFKIDGRRLDYPEQRKIENRLRAWLGSYALAEDEVAKYLRTYMDMFESLKKKGWICRNPNRQRTLMPCEKHAQVVTQVVRSDEIPVHEEQLRGIASDFQLRTKGP